MKINAGEVEVWDYWIGVKKVTKENVSGEPCYHFYGNEGWAGSLIVATTKKLVETLANDMGYELVKKEE